jgi:ABC-type multidrug transport system ATPase subunit
MRHVATNILQTDPFWDDLTGRETLVLYGRICGISESLVNERATKVLSCIELEQQSDMVTKLYCGGDRRKLALGISLIGDPEILLIDECCSGIDPLSSLKIWRSIADASKDAGVILATHNFQEAEALCTEIASISCGRVQFRGAETVRATWCKFCALNPLIHL